jgi:hypothetical protein
VLDCVLTAAEKVNHKIIRPLALCISHMPMSNPEILDLFVDQVLRFQLRAEELVGLAAVEFDNVKNAVADLGEILVIRTDPVKLIVSRLRQSRKFHIVDVILRRCQKSERLVLENPLLLRFAFFSIVKHGRAD